ncbi:hypothetical protein DUNSADRAFT_17212 [Dunaliella salina]|uniref:Encoded protein n=1 Tax=Dunaliella salina TaxID=3046 RepID=A0ABQ7G258_DUNSA|nr:hypothetical protein DUNSADRAFT_17212 [Dunaliella salina]|eukprot:KAF5828687.1 hypothetical protein DUNSADRAFT_17212 [Dunaliella salina]
MSQFHCAPGLTDTIAIEKNRKFTYPLSRIITCLAGSDVWSTLYRLPSELAVAHCGTDAGTDGILPITPWVTYCIHLHMDKLTEILTSAPMGFLVPVRILLGVASGGMYEQVGMTLPRLQGALVHAAGLFVAVLVDWHYRFLYQAYKARHHRKSEGALDLGPRLSTSASKAAQAEVPPLDAITSKAVPAEELPLDASAAEDTFDVPFSRESFDVVAGCAGEAVCTQASNGSHTPHALTAMLGESPSPGESICSQQESLKRGSLVTTLRQRRYRYKSKSAQMERVRAWCAEAQFDVFRHHGSGYGGKSWCLWRKRK